MKKKTATSPRHATPAAKLFRFAAFYVLPGSVVLYALNYLFFHTYLNSTNLFLMTLLAVCVMLLLAQCLSWYQIWLWKTQRELYEDAAVSRVLYHSGNDAVFLYPLTGNGEPGHFLAANDVACQRLGYAPEEFVALTLESLATTSNRSSTRARPVSCAPASRCVSIPILPRTMAV